MKTITNSLLLTISFIISYNPIFAESEPNNLASEANTASFGSMQTGHINASTDRVDWWKFVVVSTGKLEITLSSVIVANVNNFPVELFHSEDTENRITYTNLTTPTSIVVTVIPGTYYLKFNTYNNEGDYSFNTSLTPTFFNPDAGEQNGNVTVAVNVQSNPFTGAIGHYCGQVAQNAGFWKWDRQDWWSLITTPGDISFTITKNGADNLDVAVYHSTNTALGAHICKAVLTTDSVSIQAIGGNGNYKIQVSNSEAYPGSYRISYKLKSSGVADLGSDFGEISLFPNPTHKKITLNNMDNINEIEVYNLLGEKVHTTYNMHHYSSIEIELDNLKSGIYMVKCHAETASTTIKVILE